MISLSAGEGPLLGTTTFDIGTAAGNGVATATNLRIDSTGGDKQLTATSTGLVSAVSSVFSVAAHSVPATGSNFNSGDQSSVIGQPAILTGLQFVPGGVRITLTGTSGRTYQVQRAGSLGSHGTAWESIGAATTDDSGQGELVDSNPPAGQGFYRAVQP